MEEIIIKGAKENNLKNVNLRIPRNTLTVFTGLSGSGKSTLAFDTIFAEGQRRYVESLSSYARQFLGQMEKPDVESIEGLSPAISIDQKTTSHNPRSTVGTVTEIYDYFRLLFARIGVPHCPQCGKEIRRQTVDEIADRVMSMPTGSKILVNAPVVRGRKGEYVKELNSFKKSGYGRVKIDGIVYDLQEEIKLEKNIKHHISVVVDRLIVKDGIQKRLTDSLENALKLADGLVVIDHDGNEDLYSSNYACPDCGVSLEEIEPRIFSFNTPYGACPDCLGLGFKQTVDPDLICPDKTKTIREGAFKVTGWNLGSQSMALMEMSALARAYGFSLDVPVKDLSKEVYHILMYGANEQIDMAYQTRSFSGSFKKTWEGYVNNLQRRYASTTSDGVKYDIERLMRSAPCQACHGKRLKKEALSVTVGGKNIWDVCELSVDSLYDFIEDVQKTFTPTEHMIADAIIKEICSRLGFLKNVGLNYLTLTRTAATLSGGESQRIKLSAELSRRDTGRTLYILDEPTTGLHFEDIRCLIGVLNKLVDKGNTVIVIEHNLDVVKVADHIIDLGKEGGEAGGELLVAGTPQEVAACQDSYTAKYLKK